MSSCAETSLHDRHIAAVSATHIPGNRLIKRNYSFFFVVALPSPFASIKATSDNNAIFNQQTT